MLLHGLPICLLLLLLNHEVRCVDSSNERQIDVVRTDITPQFIRANLTWPVKTIDHDNYRHFLRKARAMGVDLIVAIDGDNVESADASETALINICPKPVENNATALLDDENALRKELTLLADTTSITRASTAEVVADVLLVQKKIARAKAQFAADSSSAVCTFSELRHASPSLAQHVELVIGEWFTGHERFAVKSLDYLTSVFEKCAPLSYRSKANYLGWCLAKKFSAEAQMQKLRPDVGATRTGTDDSTDFNWLLWVLTPIISIAAIAAAFWCFLVWRRGRRQRLRATLAAAAANEPKIFDDPLEQQAYQQSLLLPHRRRPDDQQPSDDRDAHQCSSQLHDEPAPALPPRNIVRPKCAAPHIPPNFTSAAAAARRDSSDSDPMYATIGVSRAASSSVSFQANTERVFFSPPIIIHAKPPPCQDAGTQTDEA